MKPVLSAIVGAFVALTMTISTDALAQDDATTVSAVDIIATMDNRPLTRDEWDLLSQNDLGVPWYSPEQTASFVCMAGSEDGLRRARSALSASRRFEDVKEDYRSGRADENRLVSANDRRQRTLADMIQIDFYGRAELARTRYGSLTIEAIDYRIEDLEGEQILVATVKVTNHGARTLDAPDITLKALDRNYRVLADVTYSSPLPIQITSGQSRFMEIAFLNMPYYTHDVQAHFGRGSYNRNSRNCLEAARYHRSGRPLSAVDVAALGIPLMFADAAPRATFEMTGSEIIDSEDGKLLAISGSFVNHSDEALPNPGVVIQLIDNLGDPVGQVVITAGQLDVPGGSASDFTLQIAEAEPLPASRGRDPLELMQRVRVIVD